ncbi:MAG TPA: alanine racemase [Candidatus Nanopelagicales bacterium]|nr:alanine racemase [Candidatus Nanopelagicales bacterium]
MTFTLHVEGARWREHTERARDAVRAAISAGAHTPTAGDLVPVAKGNGYGLGNVRCVREAQRLGLTRVAVGTVYEVAEVAASYDGDILVLTPYEPADRTAAAAWGVLGRTPYADRVVRTVSSRAAWDGLVSGTTPSRVILEALTSIGRFGMVPAEIQALLADAATLEALGSGHVRLEGLALHEPIAQPHVDRRTVAGSRWHDASVSPLAPAGATRRVEEVLSAGLGWQTALADLTERLSGDARTDLTTAAALWVSHLDDGELRAVRAGLPDIALYARIGTRLWLGDRGALEARGTVLAVHDVSRGQASGYRQRRASKDGAVIVVGGGTSHGVALEAPSPASSSRQRVVAAGTGVLEGIGRSLSPFVVGGKQRWFAEPPHMHVSLVRVPEGIVLPQVGDEIPVDVRLTTIHPDRVHGLD